jgi:hypothetical protein
MDHKELLEWASPFKDLPGLGNGEVAIFVADHSPDANSRHGRHGRRRHCRKGSLARASSQSEQARPSLCPAGQQRAVCIHKEAAV